jgi:hypothetical protein
MEKYFVHVGMNRDGVTSRRGFIRSVGLGAAGLASLSFTDVMAAHADEIRKRNMACILLWMSGGPSQMETFDPKPGTGNGGETKGIETSVPGISIANGWEALAKSMKDVTIIRSMTNKEGNHQRATYQLHTGYVPSSTVRHPCLGSVAAAELGDPKCDLPHIVSIGPGQTPGAGMLGVAYEPFLVGDPLRLPENAVSPVGTARFGRRLGLMHQLDEAGFGMHGGADRVKEHQSIYRQTANMVLSPHMKAFDVATEDEKLRDAYGKNPFGQGCLLARRLVEAGVTFVEVRLGGWDTHDDNFNRVKKLAGTVAPAFSTLIADLKSRGMLDKTLILWMGEFGRTPKINPRGGRDHFPKVFNVALAGGGVKGGQVIGSSNETGTDVKDHPVAVTDLLTSVCHSLKINPKKENMSPIGRPIKIVDGGSVVRELFS